MSILREQQGVDREYHLRMPKYFQYPTNLLHRVYQEQVVLESIFTRDLTAYGTVRVSNCSFDKRVFVRFTIDQWKNFSVISTQYLMHHSDSNTDSFQFKLTVPIDKLLILLSPQKSSSLVSIGTISFAICYRVNGQEFWDNNYSRNYNLDIVESPPEETEVRSNQSSSRKSIIRDDSIHRQIAQDYQTVSNASEQTGRICGLENLGGTCYMNSVLQSLSLTSLLTDSCLLDNDISLNNLSISKGIITREYLNLLYLLCCGKYSIVTPKPLKQIIGYINYGYLENQQQDAHEFLMLLLDYLHKDLSRIKSDQRSYENEEIEYNLIDQAHTNSIIVDLFYGTYKSTTTCLQCLHASSTFEPFVCLTLPIPSTQTCTLQDCLAHLNTDEYLSDDSKWFCSKCQYRCNAKRRLEIEKLPKILIIQLKRFEMNVDMQWIKNNTLVLYPEDNLDLHQCCSSSPSQQTLYTLYSVINHNGSLNDGHYTTFSRDLSLNQPQWFECDDQTITRLNSDALNLNSNAYLLFYTIKQTLG